MRRAQYEVLVEAERKATRLKIRRLRRAVFVLLDALESPTSSRHVEDAIAEARRAVSVPP